jgi:heat shock protein HslJ
MRRAGVAIASCALLTLFACASDDAAGGATTGGDLTGVTWVLDHASMMTLVDMVPTGARIDIAFDAADVHGHAACNSYGGGYEADASAGSLSFSDLASTQMACDPPLMDLEAAYLRAIGDVTGYQVTGDQTGLVLTGGTAALTFTPQAPTEALPLEGTAWTLTTIATPDSQAVSSTIAGTKVSAQFDTGMVSGSGGCNTYHGTYETSDSSLTFGPLAATRMMCEQDVSTQEQGYLAALDATASFTIDGDQLSLSDDAGQMLLQFSGKPIR